MRRMEGYLKEITSKMKHLHRDPKADEDDLKAVLAANRTEDGRFSFQQRFDFVMEHQDLKRLLEDLKGEISSLGEIVEALGHHQTTVIDEPQPRALRLARELSRVRDNSGTVFRAIRDSCVGCCNTEHMAYLKLCGRLHLENNHHQGKDDTSIDKDAFDILLGNGRIKAQLSVTVTATNSTVPITLPEPM
ncbi:hypothetical protein Micbo1qcDRAFT_203058 [Microdochium bolleyi]|uniref:Uncharacterized protein n=1 Tax=Microdochium bolleyi TaxID=196109 RepID=A0A136J944_9PEZI|nr:hypothetical protein Micbo1qcDRAFT_203058 [Microdochium bolleyi]